MAKRMQREKVNGNGIRTAGNPLEEPDLDEFPPLPPIAHRAQVAAIVPPVSSLPVKAEPAKAAPRLSPPSPDPDGVHATFPLRLQRILDKLEADGETDILSWLPHGRAFIVRDADRFVDELMPAFFNQTKYSSFQRQLSMYGFSRLTSNGPDKGAYHAQNFVRGQPGLAFTMRRTRINGNGTRKPGNPKSEPDFYKLAYMPPIPPGTRIVIPLERLSKPQDDLPPEDSQDDESMESGCDED